MADQAELRHAQRAEAFWGALATFAVPFIMVATSIFFEDLEIHEVVLAGIEGISIWRRNHWSKQVEQLQAGGVRTKANLNELPGHLAEHHVRRAPEIRAQHKARAARRAPTH